MPSTLPVPPIVWPDLRLKPPVAVGTSNTVPVATVIEGVFAMPPPAPIFSVPVETVVVPV